MKCQEREYSSPGSHWADLPKGGPVRGEPAQGRANQPQTLGSVYLILEDASTGVTPQYGGYNFFKTL
jgi:hypothetical protein